MADQNQENPPPLLLFPAGGELAPGAFRPVPVAANLFPAEEEGEADSFLGQSDPGDQPPMSQPSTFSFFQQQGTPTPNQADPFANISQSNSQIAPPPQTQPQPPPQAPATVSSPAMTPPRVSSPPSGFLPAPFSGPSQPPMSEGQSYSAQGPPPTGPAQVRSALAGSGPRSLQHRPMAHPVSGPPPMSSPPMMAPPTGPPPTGFPMQQPQVGILVYNTDLWHIQ